MRLRAMTAVGGAAVVLALAACAGAGPGETSVDLHGFPMCDEVLPLEATADSYRDSPVYVGNEQPIDAVLAWAQQQPDFAELWIDRGHNGWVSVGFTSEVAARQAEIEQEFPEDGVVAVEVPYTLDELVAVQERVMALDIEGMAGSAAMVDHGVVSADLGFLAQDRLDPLAPLAGEPICVSGRPASEMVEPGDQPTAGDGWRLLGEGLTGPIFRTGVATTPDQLVALWTEAGLDGEPPAVDFATEIAIWFGAVYGSGCPVRLDDVVVAGDTVHADLVLPTNPGACPDDANPHAYVVALERSDLPSGPFQVQLDADDPPAGVPEERTVVGVDLSVPGSTAEADDLGLDQALVDAADDGPLVASGGVVELGVTNRFELVLDEGCGARLLGELNGVTWVTDELGDASMPPEWESATTWGGGEASLVVAVTITEQAPDPRLEAERNDRSVMYRPAVDADVCG